jgi:hypothetical protein
MSKFVTFGMVLVTLVLGSVMVSAAAPQASASATANVSFTIPSWISLVVSSGASVGFTSITGPGTYAGSATTNLRVISTTAWTLSDQILWTSSTLPTGANAATQSTLNSALARSYTSSGTWGQTTVPVTYTLTLADTGLANLPAGDYALVVQYTATTND